MKESVVVLAALTMTYALCGCRRSVGGASDFATWLGPQVASQVLPRQAEVIRRNYDIRVDVIKGASVSLPWKPNDVYTVTNGSYVAFSPASTRSLGDVWPVRPERTYILACISVKPGANYVGLMKVKVGVSSGPMAGAIVTLKPGDFLGDEDAFGFPVDHAAPVYAVYAVPRELTMAEGELKTELVALQYK